MIVCKKCGNQNPDGETFCTSCQSFLEWSGEKIVEAAPPAPPPPAPPEPEPGRSGRQAGAAHEEVAPPQDPAASRATAFGVAPSFVSTSLAPEVPRGRGTAGIPPAGREH